MTKAKTVEYKGRSYLPFKVEFAPSDKQITLFFNILDIIEELDCKIKCEPKATLKQSFLDNPEQAKYNWSLEKGYPTSEHRKVLDRIYELTPMLFIVPEDNHLKFLAKVAKMRLDISIN